MARKEFNLTVGTVQVLSFSNHWNYEASVTNALTTVDMTVAPINEIVYLKNEDTVNDLFVAFDEKVPTAAILNGNDGTFRLGPGESLNDVKRYCAKLRLIRSAGTGNVRFMGVGQ